MFDTIFVETDLKKNKRALEIIDTFKSARVKYIDKIEDIFNRVKKPYLQKNESLNLFLGNKKGQLVKEAPDAYGLSGEPHYYFIHAYNCIYECNYCYLQGYFNSPDIVVFLNHREICDEIERVTLDCDKKGLTPWFHAGEFSDSLALTHITGELEIYHELFSRLPQAKLELRTKSANVKELLKLPPKENIITSFSLSPADKIQKNDLKTPSLKARLVAIKKLVEAGHKVGIHFDPVVYDNDFKEKYQDLINDLFSILPVQKLEYISVGVIRFTKDVYHQVRKNYPESELLSSELIKSFDGKIRYNRPMRLWILSAIKELLLEAGVKQEKIYLCMEDDDLESIAKS
ncbi:putative lyase [Halobacteriovorax marinus SJ]|uniref:Lyase n=1 Tax=Halobacteriovorax marinus (strain ATCC BAA-682 / DSM 15412 / SJ) TaxID=862908 RepID=E1WXW4_HALMS|nr:lyase [Halobacteriovorax marinus]CBW25921.1 putative lyase [Halobacteriovorax marinus SJ]